MAKTRKAVRCRDGYRKVKVRIGHGRPKSVCALSGRSGLAKAVAAKTGGKVTSAQASKVLAALADVARVEARKAPVVIPGVVKLRPAWRKATKAKTIPSPFKPGAKLKIKARAGHRTVRARVLSAVRGGGR